MASNSRNIAAEAGGRDRFTVDVLDPWVARVLLLTAATIVVGWGLVRSLFALFGFPPTLLMFRIFYGIDAIGLLVVAASLLLLRQVPLSAAARPFNGAQSHASASVVMLAGLVVVVAWAGSTWIMLAFPISRDEAMAIADAEAFASGHLLTPVAPEWRSYLRILHPEFAHYAADNSYWTSLYFPVNAMVRALFLKFGAADIAAPLVAGLSVVLAFQIARLLWPDRIDAALVAAVLVGLSPQVVMTAMTPYAMSLHLLATLVWLRFWMRGDAIGHAGALVTGFCAVGIHQVLFHPLMVAPFILSLLWDRRWRLAALYIGVYAMICAFWLAYWPLAAWLTGITLVQIEGGGAGTMVDRVMFAVAKFKFTNLVVLPLHLLKFVGWQHVLLVPLLVAAVRHWRSMPRILCLAVSGIGLMLAAVLLIVADQGHGWGYRYLHGFIGPLALAAAFGWVALTSRLGHPEYRRLSGMFAAASAVTTLVLVPVLAMKAHAFVAPLERFASAVERSGAELAIIDHYGALNLVQRNAPRLDRGVKVMMLTQMEDADLATVCRRYDVVIVGEAEWRPLGLVAFPRCLRPDIEADVARRLDVLRQLKCGRPIEIGTPR